MISVFIKRNYKCDLEKEIVEVFVKFDDKYMYDYNYCLCYYYCLYYYFDYNNIYYFYNDFIIFSECGEFSNEFLIEINKI